MSLTEQISTSKLSPLIVKSSKTNSVVAHGPSQPDLVSNQTSIESAKRSGKSSFLSSSSKKKDRNGSPSTTKAATAAAAAAVTVNPNLARRESLDPRKLAKSFGERKPIPHSATVQNGLQQLSLDVRYSARPSVTEGTVLLRTPPSTASGDTSGGIAPLSAQKRSQSDVSLYEATVDTAAAVDGTTAARSQSKKSNVARYSVCSSEQSSIRSGMSEDWPLRPNNMGKGQSQSDSSSNTAEKLIEGANQPVSSPSQAPNDADSSRSSPSLNNGASQNSKKQDDRASPAGLSVPTASSSAEGLEAHRKKSKGTLKSAFRTLVNKTYAQRDAEFRKQFADSIGPNERYVTEYHCAYMADRYLLQQGKIYITQNNLLFSSRMFRNTKLRLPFMQVTAIKKEKTIRLIQNALRVSNSDGRSFFFASLASRNETYNVLTRLVSSAQEVSLLSNFDFWTLVHTLHGAELGFSQSPPNSTNSIGRPANSTMCSNIADYPDYQEYLAAAQRNGGTINLALLSGAGKTRALANGAKAETEANNAALKNESFPTTELLFADGSDRGNDSDDEDDLEPDTSISPAVSYTSLSNAFNASCCGHSKLDMHCLEAFYDLSVSAIYDGLMNLESRVARRIYELQKSKVTSVEPWQFLQPTDADLDRLPTREDQREMVKIVKMQRRIIYLTGFTMIVTTSVVNHETQTVLLKHAANDPNRIYSFIIDTRVDPTNIAIAKNSYVLRQLCSHRVSENPHRSLLIASQQSVFKNGIQRQTMQSHLNARFERYYKQLNELFVEEAQFQAVELRSGRHGNRPVSTRTAGSSDSSQPSVVSSAGGALPSLSPSPPLSPVLAPETLQLSSNQAKQSTAPEAKHAPKSVINRSEHHKNQFTAPLRHDHQLQRQPSELPAKITFLLFITFVLAFVVWSQLTLHWRLESIELLLQELIVTVNKGDLQNPHAQQQQQQSVPADTNTNTYEPLTSS